MNSHKLLYNLYLESRMWQRRRERALDRAGNRCEYPGCGEAQHLHVHHLSYDRLGEEADEDLIVLCRTHHELVHAKPMEAIHLRKQVYDRETRAKRQEKALARIAATIVDAVTKVIP